MFGRNPNCSTNFRLVGDPVDVVTGTQTDFAYDFVLPGPLPIYWNRYYSSERRHEPLPLGFGHTHEFDHLLTLDLDGLTYRGPEGSLISFPEVEIGGTSARSGHVVRRMTQFEYQVRLPSRTFLDVVFRPEHSAARPHRLGRDELFFTLEYDHSGKLAEIVEPLRRRLAILYDLMGRVVQVTRATGMPDRRKTLITYVYDEDGNLIHAKDVNGFTQSFQYDQRHLLIRRTDRKGYSFLFTYDAQGRCTHSTGEDGLFEVQLEYDRKAKTTFVRKCGGPPSAYFYNDAGSLTQITDPYGAPTKFTLDEQGRVTEHIDPNGNVTRIAYDHEGKVAFRSDPNGRFIPSWEPVAADPYAYHLPESALDWEFGYWLDRRKIQAPRSDDRLRELFRVAVGTTLGATDTYQSSASNPNETVPASTALLDDDFGRPLERPALGRAERWIYDANGNLIEHHDNDGAVEKWIFASWNAPRQIIDGLGNITTYEHFPSGLPKRVTDAGGTVTEYAYDYNDRLTEVRRHGRVRETYVRDNAGNIVAKTIGGEAQITWEIGPGNLDKVRTLASGERHEFSYDSKGRVVAVNCPTGKMSFAYDNSGNLLADLRDGLGVVHEYRNGGRALTKYLDRFCVHYQQHSDSLLVIDPSGGRHQFHRSPSGFILKNLHNGTRELCQYDRNGRCARKSQYHPMSASSVWTRIYSYSAEGDLTEVNDSYEGRTKYRYDATHRLTYEEWQGQSGRRFAFDAAGNLVAQPGLSDVVIGPGNRMVEANGESFEYNRRDHLCTRRGTGNATHYVYDDLDRLVHCDIDGERWTAAYDAYCRRTKKTWRGMMTVSYWDDFRLAAEVRPDASVRIYVYSQADALVPFLFVEYASLDAPPESGERFYIFTNQIGVPVRVDDDAGIRRWSARIGPFGLAEVANDSSIDMPLRFPGHYFDEETGLHSNRFRAFAPDLGRYLQSDPAGLEGGINLYAYPVNPLVGADIDGLGAKAPKPKSPRQGKKGEGPPQQSGPTPTCIVGMDDKQLQDFCKKRADELNAQIKNPRDREGVVIAVTVVQKPGDPSSRRVIITSSQNDGRLPAPLEKKLHPHESVPHPPVPLLKEKPGATENRPLKPMTLKDEKGKPSPVLTSDDDPSRMKRTDQGSPQPMGTHSAEMKKEPVPVYNVTPGQEESTPYAKKSQQNPDGRSEHHAEQRAQNAVGPNEEVAAMAPSKPCCSGCRKSLGDDGLSKVPEDRRGTDD